VIKCAELELGGFWVHVPSKNISPRGVPTERADLPPVAVNDALHKVLTSKMFARSERLSRFLRFVTEQTLQGNAEKLKEYVVGLEVFDRQPEYDPRFDPIVRVEARRLRAKLRAYYRTEGSGDPVCIGLPERGYAPTFDRRKSESSERATAPEESVSIAVLPFLNISPDRENEYFSDGLTEELICVLGSIEGFRVVARTSVFQLKGRALDIRYFGAQLNASMVLEGSVRREGGRVRISAQLVGVADGYQLWSETYEREVNNVFAVQGEIARAIGDALKAPLGLGLGRLSTKRHPEDADASNLYLQGRYFLNLRTEAGFLRALECFRKAIERHPRYALAYAGLADAYSLGTRYDVLPAKEAWPKAKAAALESLALDDKLAEAHTALAFVKLHYEREWDAAEGEFRRALEINPSYAVAHQWSTWALAVLGRFEDAVASMKRAYSLDPLSPNVAADLALAYYFARQYENAVEQCQDVIELHPGFYRPHQLLGMIYLQQKLYAEAITELQQAAIMSGGNCKVLALLACAQSSSGNPSGAKQTFRELLATKPYVPPVDLALVHSALGERDQMFDAFEKAYEDHDGELIWLPVDPIYDSFREEPRFQTLLEKLTAMPIT
jgi:serine/threonine-protein kinase